MFKRLSDGKKKRIEGLVSKSLDTFNFELRAQLLLQPNKQIEQSVAAAAQPLLLPAPVVVGQSPKELKKAQEALRQKKRKKEKRERQKKEAELAKAAQTRKENVAAKQSIEEALRVEQQKKEDALLQAEREKKKRLQEALKIMETLLNRHKKTRRERKLEAFLTWRDFTKTQRLIAEKFLLEQTKLQYLRWLFLRLKNRTLSYARAKKIILLKLRELAPNRMLQTKNFAKKRAFEKWRRLTELKPSSNAQDSSAEQNVSSLMPTDKLSQLNPESDKYEMKYQEKGESQTGTVLPQKTKNSMDRTRQQKRDEKPVLSLQIRSQSQQMSGTKKWSDVAQSKEKVTKKDIAPRPDKSSFQTPPNTVESQGSQAFQTSHPTPAQEQQTSQLQHNGRAAAVVAGSPDAAFVGQAQSGRGGFQQTPPAANSPSLPALTLTEHVLTYALYQAQTNAAQLTAALQRSESARFRAECEAITAYRWSEAARYHAEQAALAYINILHQEPSGQEELSQAQEANCVNTAQEMGQIEKMCREHLGATFDVIKPNILQWAIAHRDIFFSGLLPCKNCLSNAKEIDIGGRIVPQLPDWLFYHLLGGVPNINYKAILALMAKDKQIDSSASEAKDAAK